MKEYLQSNTGSEKEGSLCRLILDSAFEGVMTLSTDGNITSWNKGAEKMYGYTEQEMIGRSIQILVPEDKSKELSGILEKVRSGQKVEQLETHRITKGRATVEIVISATPIYRDGNVIGIVVFHKDISLQKEAEKSYSELFELASVAIFIADTDGRYTQVNTAACKLSGYSKEELIGKTIFDLIPTEEAQRLEESRQILLTPGEIQVAEWTMKKKDGTLTPIEVSANILPDGRWQAYVKDISQQRKVEKKFQFIFESAPDPQLLVDKDGLIQMANRQCEETFGYSHDELIGQNVEVLIPERFLKDHPTFRQEFLLGPENRRMGSGQQLWIRNKDGGEVQVDMLLSTISIFNETIILATIRDLSEIKKLADYARNIGDSVNRLYYSYH